MSLLLFCRRMGLTGKCLSRATNVYLTFIFSVFLADICGAFTVYKTTSSDDMRSSVSDPQRRLSDIRTSEFRMKDILSDYLEEQDPNRDLGGDVILHDFIPDVKSDYPDTYLPDGPTSEVTVHERESPLYSHLIKVILEEDVQSPDASILRQKRPSYPGILGFDNLDFAMTTLKGNGRETNPPSRSSSASEEVFAPSNRQQKHRPPPMGQNRRGWLSVGNGNTNMSDIQRMVQKMIEKG